MPGSFNIFWLFGGKQFEKIGAYPKGSLFQCLHDFDLPSAFPMSFLFMEQMIAEKGCMLYNWQKSMIVSGLMGEPCKPIPVKVWKYLLSEMKRKRQPEKQITAPERNLRREKLLNRKMEMYSELKHLRINKAL